MRPFSFFVNFAYAVFYYYCWYFDLELTRKYNFLPIPGVYASKFVWLTMITFLLLTVHHTLGALFSVVTPSKNSRTGRAFHFLATSLVFPLAMTVVVLFWTLFLYDRKTLIPKEAEFLEEYAWFNHALHTTPLIGMTVDAIAWRHPRPRKLSALKLIFFLVVLYVIDIHVVYWLSGFWAYPVLANLSVVERLAFILGCSGVVFASFLVTDSFNALLQNKLQRKKKN